jgi:hypothetical protein
LPDNRRYSPDLVNDPCSLYGAQCSVIESWQLQRTLLAILFAVMLSLMFAPHSGRGLLRFAGYAHGPFFITPSQVDRKQFVLQTIIIAVAAVVIVNLFPRRGRK